LLLLRYRFEAVGDADILGAVGRPSPSALLSRFLSMIPEATRQSANMLQRIIVGISRRTTGDGGSL
jgi:hypothetical protein